MSAHLRLPNHVMLAATDAVRLGRAIELGQSINLALSPSEVSVSEEMETYLPGYRPFGGYRADEISPIVLVDKDVGTYRIYGLNNIFRLIHTETSYLAPVPEVDPETTTASYAVIPHALGTVISPATERQANYNLRQMAARKIADALALRREFSIISYARTLNNWDAAARTTLTSGTKWNGGVSSDPIADLQARIEASTQEITDIYLGTKTAHAFLNNLKVRDYVRAQIGDAGLQSAMISAMHGPSNGPTNTGQRDFFIPGINATFHIASGKYLNSAGQLVEIIGGDVILTSNPPGNAEFDGITTFKTLRARQGSGNGWITREFRQEEKGLLGADKMVAGYAEAYVMPSNSAGGLIKDAYQ